ncbi:hypothetical protein SISSUDRAFT_1056155 [Sistotremastrum suecicum HHB10207 ss-3]|uniref:HRDC domain-containing protein n=1 Tax=Sistotremastrum suecicum HHB10207 ss-3 TaxID=1314776 RepID=A0A165X717_9AGAM|nr:hypothetical protein SISSUDRAFT_1056155 [Sistotremastrum suecicum HHB10207 ss-3]
MTSKAKAESLIGDANFSDFQTRLQAAILAPTKKSMSLPKDIQFHRTLESEFAKELDSCADRLLSLTNKLIRLADGGSSAKQSGKRKGKAKLETEDDVVDGFRSRVVDSMENLLERTDLCLDEFLGRGASKPAAIPIKPAPEVASRVRLPQNLFHASHLPKPQLKFRRTVDNSNESNWKPLLRTKPNALAPLDYPQDSLSNQLPHPYGHEIANIDFPQGLFSHVTLQEPSSMNETPFSWVSTREELAAMFQQLRTVSEIAVDLEHHDYRTFSGFLCLMQISTRGHDFVVDTLALRDELEILNGVFTDPTIVKVFHGAESDIIWLQQNFGLYIVNLFDTYHASKVLEFQKHSLASLLSLYCDFIADKKYQMADWRIRPLPNEMLQYARSDTHFLLFVYDNMKNALLDKAEGRPELVLEVLERSKQTSLRTYVKEIYDSVGGNGPGGWNTLLQKWGRGLTGLQLAVFKAVHGWRDQIARKDDESTRYVMSNNHIFQLAEHPPADMTALMQTLPSPSPPVRTRLKQLLELIRETVREQLEEAQNAAKSTADPVVVEAVPVIQSSTFLESRGRNLWDSRDSTLSATASSLFRNIVKTSSPYAASASSLLGNRPDHEGTEQSDEFRQIVARIHGSIRLAPSVDNLKIEPGPSKLVEAEEVEVEEMVPVQPAEMLDLTFVPATERKKTSGDVMDNVVVGRQRKRKRKEPSTTPLNVESEVAGPPQAEPHPSAPEPNGAKKKKARHSKEQEEVSLDPFDYATASNLLDDIPDKKASDPAKRKKEKKKKPAGTGLEYGNFPAPPKAHSEFKGGNLSHSYQI